MRTYEGEKVRVLVMFIYYENKYGKVKRAEDIEKNVNKERTSEREKVSGKLLISAGRICLLFAPLN